MDSRDAVLAALLKAGGEFISGQALGETLGISRAAVHRHVDSLRELGYAVHSVRNRGYRLTAQPDRLDPPRIGALLHTAFLGRSIRCLDSVDSTNRYLKAWAEEGAPGGALVLAEEQTAGRGRRGRQWLCPAGSGLMMSFLLRPDMPPGDVQKVTLVAAVAAARAVESVCPRLRPVIKWPNDVLVGTRKICGILTELSATAESMAWIVVGMGVNVRGGEEEMPPELRQTATTLAAEGCPAADRNALAAGICNAFETLWNQWLASGSFAGVLEGYRRRMAFRGMPVRVTLGDRPLLEGALEGVDDEGRLLIATGDGIEPVRSGEVTLRRK